MRQGVVDIQVGGFGGFVIQDTLSLSDVAATGQIMLRCNAASQIPQVEIRKRSLRFFGRMRAVPCFDGRVSPRQEGFHPGGHLAVAHCSKGLVPGVPAKKKHALVFGRDSRQDRFRQFEEVCDKQGGTEATGYLTREELKALVSAPDCSSQLGRRDRTLLLLMSSRGLRVSEVIALSLQDVQLGEMDAHVICNAGSATERKTPLGQECLGALRNWVGERRVGPSDPLFSSTHGKALSQDAVQHLVRKHAKKASVHCPSLEGKRVSPHVLRRTAAKHLLQEGNDPDMVARWLGYRPGARIRIGPNSDGRLKEGPKNRSEGSGLYQPDQKDELLLFLESLDHG